MTVHPLQPQSLATTNGQTALVLPVAEIYGAVMAFSLRSGGCSPPPFGSLNLSVQQGDTANNVQRNLEVLGTRLKIDHVRIATCRQVHGDEVAILDEVPSKPPHVDAMITGTSDVYLGIRTADCVPILLIDTKRRVAAAVHAGWRGTVRRITRKTVRLMKERWNSRPEDLIAALGPAIRGCCYEVDDTVLAPFRDIVPNAERFISRSGKADSRGERCTLDLVAANRAELTREGIPPVNIHDVDLCTCCSPDQFFSYRRDGRLSGRHMAITGFRIAPADTLSGMGLP